MGLADDALSILDEGRALLDELGGLCKYDVAVRVRRWPGERPGQDDASAVDTDTPLTVARGKRPVVTQVVDEDVAQQSNLYSKTRYDIELTPKYAGGGVDVSVLDPPVVAGQTIEVFYVLKGPGLPATGALCRKVADRYDSPFTYVVTIETLGQEA